MDYLLGMGHYLFQNISTQDPFHNTDHFMLLGCLCIAATKNHSQYLGIL